MRYVVAMIFALLAAAGCILWLGSPVASWAVDKMTFDNPDQVGDMHSLIFMATNLAGLLFGWALGWSIGGVAESNARE